MWLTLLSGVIGAGLGYVYTQLPKWLDRHASTRNSEEKLPNYMTMLLDAFEEARLKHVKKAMVVDLSLFTFFGAFSGYYFTELDARMAKLYLFVLLVFVGIMFLRGKLINLKKFTKEYKTEVLGGLIGGLNPNLSYSSTQRIPDEALKASGLFGIDKVMDSKMEVTIEGEDHVFGEIDGVSLQISDLEVFKGEGERVSLVFTGTFLVAEFPEEFQGSTFVMPDFSGAGVLQDLLHQVSKKKTFKVEAPAIPLADEPFEKVYDVFGTDENATRTLMGASVREHLLALDGKSGDKIQVAVSFKGNRMYLGSLFSYLRFEPKLHRPVNREEDWQLIYTQLGLYLGLIDEVRKGH